MMKKRILTMDDKSSEVLVCTNQLRVSQWVDPKAVKLYKNSHIMLEETKMEFDGTVYKLERIRFNLNTANPSEREIETFESLENDPFFEAIDISECVLTFDTVLSPTAVIRILVNKSFIPVRAIMYSGSSCHLMTNKCRERLNLPLFPPQNNAQGDNSTGFLGTTQVTFSPNFATSPLITVQVYVTKDTFSETPMIKVHPSVKEKLGGRQLADPNFDIPGEVDMLFNTLPDGESTSNALKFDIEGTKCSAFNSTVGWIVTGRAPVEEIQVSVWAKTMLNRISRKIDEGDRYFRTVRPDFRFLS